MDRTVAIHTPESIAFSYELAGLGSRFIAVLLDLLAQLVLASLIVWGLVALGSHVPKEPPMSSVEEKAAASLAVAIVIFFVFAIFFGYFIIFEAAWGGQTPGKRLAGIRVVRDGGFPVDFMSALIRNLVRTLEFGLGFYVVSAVACLLSSENKRLGDYAAGTLVVRDSRIDAPRSPDRTASGALQLSSDQRELVERFMDRRAELAADRRAELAARIADSLRPKVSADFASLGDEGLIERVSALL